MNFQNLNFDYVERPITNITHHAAVVKRSAASQPPPQTSPRVTEDSQSTIRPSKSRSQPRLDPSPQDNVSSRRASSSSQLTIIPRPPTPPSDPSSETDIYGPGRFHGQAPVPMSEDEFARLRREPRLTLDEVGAMAARDVGAQAFADMASSARFKDELALAAGKVTPGVDDTPYIHYALEALTRDPASWYSKGVSSAYTASSNPGNDGMLVPDRGLNYYNPQRNALPSQPEPAQLRQSSRRADEPAPDRRPLEALDPLSKPQPQPQPPSTHSSLSTLVTHPKGYPTMPFPKDSWTCADQERMSPNAKMLNPRPDFRPAILRPLSMMILMTLCLLMITALIFTAVWSHTRKGLVAYIGTIYSGQYFVFRILPQLLAAGILIYAQCIITTTIRILPFTRLEAVSTELQDRPGALFQDMYPRSFLWPTLVGTWHTWIPILVVWLANMTLPLQSALFTFVLVDGQWRWAAVQGVAWTLAALYIALLASALLLMRFWKTRRTGLLWDPRSIADFAALVARSNTLRDYRGTELMTSRRDLRRALRGRCVDKLGYWYAREQRDPAFWYALGTDVEDQTWLRENVGSSAAGASSSRPGRGTDFDHTDVEKAASPVSPRIRNAHLPWVLRSSPLLFLAVSSAVLLAALLAVSFLPATSIRRGFPARLSSVPGPGGFSPADFLYSFLPSLLGLLPALLLQDVDLALRVLEPWAELARHERTPAGAHPQASILADYAACLPLQAALRAARNRHLRLALVSLLSPLLVVFLPALAGALFTALTQRDGSVRMIPHVPVLGVVLALLVLFVAALVALLPGRGPLRLPHGVGCLAEVFSFLGGGGGGEDGDDDDDVGGEESVFRDVRYKRALRGRIGVDRMEGARPGWVFGFGNGGGGRLAVRRARRFTERRTGSRRGGAGAAAGAAGYGYGREKESREGPVVAMALR